MPYRFILVLQLFCTLPLFALTDESFSLEEVLEKGTLSEKDCERYRQGASDEETLLRCGKWMFFYDSLGVPGLPAGVIDLMREHAPKTAGSALEAYGLFKDPYSAKGLPIGFVPGPKLTGWVPAYTTTCGSCHFGQLPDGRYVVGQPNHSFDFAGLVLAVSTLPELAINPKKALLPLTKQKLEPLTEEFFGHKGSRWQVFAQLIRLLPKVIIEKLKPLSNEQKENLSQMPTGVFDIFFPPVIDDRVAVPLRILPLWGLDPEGMVQGGSTHGGMISSTGGQPDFEHGFKSVVKVSDLSGAHNAEATHPPEYFKPIIAYIASLKTKSPRNLKTFDQERVERGAALFSQSCAHCHNGPGYAGTRIFSFEEIGTDPNLAFQLDPEGTGKAMLGILKDYEMTGGVRAGRLAGFWSMKRYLHNGALASLDELFCLDGPRPPSTVDGMGTSGHMFTCEGLSREEKSDLIEFIESL